MTATSGSVSDVDRRGSLRGRLREEWPAALALALVAFAFVEAVGRPGAVGAVGVAAGWLVLSTPHALAIGHVALVGLAPSGLGPARLAALEGAFLAFVLADVAAKRERTRTLVVALAVAALFVGAAQLARTVAGGPWGAALALCATGTVLAYGLHRLAHVRLDPVRSTRQR